MSFRKEDKTLTANLHQFKNTVDGG